MYVYAQQDALITLLHRSKIASHPVHNNNERYACLVNNTMHTKCKVFEAFSGDEF